MKIDPKSKGFLEQVFKQFFVGFLIDLGPIWGAEMVAKQHAKQH